MKTLQAHGRYLAQPTIKSITNRLITPGAKRQYRIIVQRYIYKRYPSHIRFGIRHYRNNAVRRRLSGTSRRRK